MMTVNTVVRESLRVVINSALVAMCEEAVTFTPTVVEVYCYTLLGWKIVMYVEVMLFTFIQEIEVMRHRLE